MFEAGPNSSRVDFMHGHQNPGSSLPHARRSCVYPWPCHGHTPIGTPSVCHLATQQGRLASTPLRAGGLLCAAPDVMSRRSLGVRVQNKHGEPRAANPLLNLTRHAKQSTVSFAPKLP